MSMPDKDTRFIVGEDLKAGDVAKYTSEFGIVRADSQVCPGHPMLGPARFVSKSGTPATSPYNAKPVPKFEVILAESEPRRSYDSRFIVKMITDSGCWQRGVSEDDRRGWFSRESWADAIVRVQYEMAKAFQLTLRLSGSAETLTGVKLDV